MKKSKQNRMYQVYLMAAGLFLIYIDHGFEFALFDLIPLPHIFAFFGVLIFLQSLTNLFAKKIHSFTPHTFSFKEKSRKAQTRFTNGVIAATNAGALACIFWIAFMKITGYHYGILSTVVAWAVSTGMILGSKGMRGRLPQVFSTGITIILVFISEYLINWIIFSEVLAESGQGQPVLFLPLDFFFSFIRNSIEMEPLTILYWAIAIIFPFARLQHKEKEPSNEEPDENPQELPAEFNETV